MNLTLRIFLALLAGLVVGALLPADIGKPLLPVTDAIGNLWLQALQMTIIPLIAGLLFTGIAQSVGQAGGGKVAGRALLAFLALLIFSALWSMIFVPLLLDWWPAPPAAAAAIVANSAGAAPAGDIKIDLGKWLLSLVPANIFDSLAKGDMLPVVTFIAMFALAATRLDDDRRRSLVGLFDAVKDAMLVLVGWIFVIAPLGVFALAVSVGIKAGLGAFGLLGHYIAVLVLVQVGLIILVYPLAVKYRLAASHLRRRRAAWPARNHQPRGAAAGGEHLPHNLPLRQRRRRALLRPSLRHGPHGAGLSRRAAGRSGGSCFHRRPARLHHLPRRLRADRQRHGRAHRRAAGVVGSRAGAGRVPHAWQCDCRSRGYRHTVARSDQLILALKTGLCVQIR